MKSYQFIFSTFAISVFMACNSNRAEMPGYSNEQSELVAMELSEPPGMVDDGSSITSKFKTESSSNDESALTGSSQIHTDISKAKIIKDGYVSVKSNDIYESKKSIDDVLKSMNAYYESEDLQNNDQTISFNLKIRIPSENFEKLISNIENGKDEIVNKNIQARDVTEEFVDIETRLANKKAYLVRYKELLTKASTVADILDIEENIRVIQEEIESKEGRLKFLNDQVAYSTLNLYIFKEKEFIFKPKPQDKFLERVKTSLSNGWNSVVNFVLWIISTWPLIIGALIAFLLVKRIIKHRKGK